MKWDTSSIQQYAANREHFDTAVIPFIHIDIGHQVEQKVLQSNWITAVANGLEEKLKGRILLFPVFTYTGNEEAQALKGNIQAYVQKLREEGFQNIVVVSCDDRWEEEDLGIIPFTLPTLKNGQEFDNNKVSQTVENLMQDLIGFWKKQ